jgi:hypothetical protein
VLRYLKAAFWIRPKLPGLGRVPINAVGVLGFGLLGFGHEGFWLLGAALETLWLWAAVQNPGFRTRVDAQSAQIELDAAAQERSALGTRLDAENRARWLYLEEKCSRARQLQDESDRSPFIAEANRDALQKLGDFALKLLVARTSLIALTQVTNEQELNRQIATLEEDIADESLSSAARESKEATLGIVRQRLANLDRREQFLDEIDSDLTRIEAQIDLALEQAGLRGPDATVSANLKFVSHFLNETLTDGLQRAAPVKRTVLE